MKTIRVIKQKNKVGRPELIDLEKVTKLEQAFAIDASVEEACSYAEVSRKVFYEYLKRHPEFSDRIATLREKPILKARQTVVKDTETPEGARWYLERKRKSEFGKESDDVAKQIFYPGKILIVEVNEKKVKHVEAVRPDLQSLPEAEAGDGVSIGQRND